MNIDYTEQVLSLFSNPKFFYRTDYKYNYMGSAGDDSVGEHINIYLSVENNENYSNSKIISARWSAIGSVMMIAAAEKFCSTIEGMYCKDIFELLNSGIEKILDIPEDRMHSVNFVLQAFYSAIEALSNYGCTTS